MEKHTLNRYAIAFILLLIPSVVLSAPPSSTYTYTTGEKIKPDEVQTNENNLYRYVQTGVDTLANNSVTTDNIVNGTITNVDISGTAAIALSKLASAPMLYADSRYVAVRFTRDVSLTTDQDVTVTGITPKAIVSLVSFSTSFSSGVSDGTSQEGLALIWGTNNYSYNEGYSFQAVADGSNYARGKIKSFGSETFTIDWTGKIGSPTGTANITVLCFR